MKTAYKTARPASYMIQRREIDKSVCWDWDSPYSVNVTTCCVFCGDTIPDFGHNPAPLFNDERCCSECNQRFVIVARLAEMTGRTAYFINGELRIKED